MSRDKTIKEAEAELDLKPAFVPLVEDSPDFMAKKKEYCRNEGLECSDCGNKWCKNFPVKPTAIN